MGLKPDEWIEKMCFEEGMIRPFESNQVGDGRISYGLSSYGYDFRLWDEFLLPSPSLSVGEGVIDPKSLNPESRAFTRAKKSSHDIPPGSFILARSLEYFRIPGNTLALCTGKSTYARAGLAVNITPLEPGWEGFITIHIFNTASSPVRVYAMEGIAQAIFLEGDGTCRVSYRDRKGKYQRQSEITPSKI